MQCSICLQEPDVPFTQECCRNIFCLDCINKWKQVKNTCPLCGAKIGQGDINTLKNQPHSNSFDNGFLMLQSEIKQIGQRINFAQARISVCRDQSKKMKSLFSSSHIIFLDDQFALLKQYKRSIDDAFLTHDRTVCVEFLQLTTELLLSIEAALNNGSFQNDYMEQEYDMEYYDPEDYEEEDYYMYEEYEMSNSRKNFQKQKKASKTAAANQQKNKSII